MTIDWKKARGLLAAGISLITFVAMPRLAQALPMTYIFDYVQLPPHVTSNPPVPGGPFGSITISDNASHPNRVDIDLTIQNIPAPYTGVGLEQFYLNFDPTITFAGKVFYLVTQGAADPPNANGNPFPVGDRLGGVQIGAGLTLGGGSFFTFDVNPDPSSAGYLFSGSLAAYNTAPSPDTPFNLNAAMFDFTTSGAGVPPMYAAFRLSPGPQGIGEFFAFASSTSTVPVPSSLLLLGSGLVGLALATRLRRA